MHSLVLLCACVCVCVCVCERERESMSEKKGELSYCQRIEGRLV